MDVIQQIVASTAVIVVNGCIAFITYIEDLTPVLGPGIDA